jgi:hypothetical protein
MRPECIPALETEQWELTALEFERRANFPHCVWVVDGKHIRILKPEHIGSMFYCYADFFRGINGRGRHQLLLCVRLH